MERRRVAISSITFSEDEMLGSVQILWIRPSLDLEAGSPMTDLLFFKYSGYTTFSKYPK